jgi:hypothetical protein
MVEAILDGRQPAGVTLPALLEGVPLKWSRQPLKTAISPLEGPISRVVAGNPRNKGYI